MPVLRMPEFTAALVSVSAPFILLLCGWQNASAQKVDIQNTQVRIALSCGPGCSWSYRSAGARLAYRFAPPTFEVDGERISAAVHHFAPTSAPVPLGNGATAYAYEGTLISDAHLRLAVAFQVNDGTPVVRFRYILRSDQPRTLTAKAGANSLEYFETSLKDLPRAVEVQISNFAELTHNYTLAEERIDNRYFEDNAVVMGPILAATDGHRSLLLAYEHGSTVPDAFLQYQLTPTRNVRLTAVKGNYFPGQAIDAGHPYSTIWFEAAAQAGDLDALASSYRRFVLKYLTANLESRKPYIFYNTWNFQERNKYWYGHNPDDSINQARVLEEIDVAHRMGVDVYVVDGGWFTRTGDWDVNLQKFPDDLKGVKARLDQYGMKLGLWIGPSQAMASSRVVREHPEWRMSTDGIVADPPPAANPDKKYPMCLESGYADYLANELIRLARETGASYFKWDQVHQYGCSDTNHHHGNASNTHQEREDSYGFQIGPYLSYIADKVAAAVPGTIVDLDMSEKNRAMGLGFLSSGKYFLMNNGPYLENYDLPFVRGKQYSNLFAYQGQARTWIGRSPLTFDKWIPSVLFLAHYFPDDPKQWQEVDLASLILGQNGIWGDLPRVSDAGVAFIGGTLAKYKRIREEITGSDPIVTGLVSGGPEIHEKISSANGKGAVVIFSTRSGRYSYVTFHKVAGEHWTSDGVNITPDSKGRAKIDATFEKPGAKILFFGVH